MYLSLVTFSCDVQSVLFHNRQSVAAATTDHGTPETLSQNPVRSPLVHTASTAAVDQLQPNSTAAVDRIPQPNSTAAVDQTKSTAASAIMPTDEGHSAAVSPSSLWQSAQASWAKMSWPTAFMLGATGAAAGVASGLLGIGGGTIVTPLLAMLTPLTQVRLHICSCVYVYVTGATDLS